MTTTENRASRTVLERLPDTLYPSQDSYNLGAILGVFGFRPGKAAWVEIVHRLSEIGGQEWGWKYADNVFRGRQRASEPFARAIETLYQQVVQRQPGAIAGAQLVSVYAQPGQVPEGVVLPRSFTWARCAHPACAALFIQRTRRQRYCDPTCGDVHRADLRRVKPTEYRCPDCGRVYPSRFALSGHQAQCGLKRL